MSTTDISARCWCNISPGWGWDVGIGLCTWRKCQHCQVGPGMMSQEQDISPGGICPPSFSVINHDWCVTQRGPGRQMEALNWHSLWTRDSRAERSWVSHRGLQSYQEPSPQMALKSLFNPLPHCKIWVKKGLYIAEVIPVLGQASDTRLAGHSMQDLTTSVKHFPPQGTTSPQQN